MEDKSEKRQNQSSALITYRILAIATILHAAILTMIQLYFPIISGRAWILFVWLWFLWPVILLIHPSRSLRRWLIPVGISILLFIPCWFEIAALTAWRIKGFAP
ncbi:MAG: hypothetical protein VB068_06790 [Petrimonas sp.]|nr:hypothetical protein [Petrimonas sp.]MEA5115288.1 hypothetical protein [Geobacteraceae bacterium]